FYDILYLEIPEKVLAILIFMTYITISFQSIFKDFVIIKTLPNFNNSFSNFQIYLIIAFGIFMIFSFYFIMLKGFKEIYDVAIVSIFIIGILYIKFILGINLEQTAIGSAILGSLVLFIFLFLQVLVSGGTWMGGGDLRIAILMGLLVGINFSFYTMLSSYMIGSIFGIGLIIYSKIKNYYENKKVINKIKIFLKIKETKSIINSQIPFGPFLALGIYTILFYSNEILNIINNYL
ncbi:MAG: hypothetical protein PHE25_05885, partial [Candidatus Gracilibacteria bacterium]|nr:hypothetical protein [Candidatus Gracilibacteria bacterium]